jgi:hypothetical protein
MGNEKQKLPGTRDTGRDPVLELILMKTVWICFNWAEKLEPAQFSNYQ